LKIVGEDDIDKSVI